MLLAWPGIPGGKSYFINGWVGKDGGGEGENMSADYACYCCVLFIMFFTWNADFILMVYNSQIKMGYWHHFKFFYVCSWLSNLGSWNILFKISAVSLLSFFSCRALKFCVRDTWDCVYAFPTHIYQVIVFRASQSICYHFAKMGLCPLWA